LFHFGNQDSYIPNEGVDSVGEAVAGRPGFVLNVESAGHAFDNHESEMFYNEAAANAAWAKTMAFLSEHMPA
jgi:carboxymethylenebutenolidase